MKLSKQYLLDELTRKSPQELAREIVARQITTVPQGFEVQYNATVQKYSNMLEKLILDELQLA